MEDSVSYTVSQAMTAPRSESSARFALAVKLLQTKPPSLSIPEYVALLRENTVSGGRALNNPSERRHIDACGFWRKHSESQAAKVIELQARVNELAGNFDALAETDKINHQLPKGSKVSCQLQSGGPAKKKVKITPKKVDKVKDVRGTVNPGQKKSQDVQVVAIGREGIFDDNISLLCGSSISDLVLSLRLLHFSREPSSIPQTITQSSQALQRVIEDFIYGGLSAPIPAAHLTRGATATKAKQPKEITIFCQVVERTCSKVLFSMTTLANSSQEQEGDSSKAATSSQFTTDGICVVVKNFAALFLSLHKNSIALLSAALYPTPLAGKSIIKDVRLELTMIITRNLTSLDTESGYQRKILEGTFYHILEITGYILLRSFITTNKDDQREIVSRLAVEETSWYLLRIIEAVFPAIAYFGGAKDGKLEDKARERLTNMLKSSIFNSKIPSGRETARNEKEKKVEEEIWEYLGDPRLGGDGNSIIESPFSRVLWGLLGLDILPGGDKDDG